MNNIHMILAATLDGVIGYREKGSNGRYLPWKKLSADMKRFAELTTGHIVVMGRKTWETLPEKYRPLPNRENIILTRDQNYTISGGLVFNSLFDILQYAKLNPEKKVWIMGGAEIYNAFEKHCTEIHMTIIIHDLVSDTDVENQVSFLPNVRNFTMVSNLTVPADENNEFHSEYIVFKRKEKIVTGSSDVAGGC